MVIDLLVTQTFGRLAGVRALLELLDTALPESEWHETEALKKMAEEQGWAFSDFVVDQHILNEKFQFWLPRFTAYSVVALLHTVVETQMGACALRVHSEKQVPFLPGDVRGCGIEAAVLYLRKLEVYDVGQDQAWSAICDIRDLRHLIIHRAGTKGDSDQHRKIAERLGVAYSGRLKFPDGDGAFYGEVWISIPLCRHFIALVEGFFDRVFDAMGLPPRHSRRTGEHAS